MLNNEYTPQQVLRKRKENTEGQSLVESDLEEMNSERSIDESCYTVLAILDSGKHIPTSQYCNSIFYLIHSEITNSRMKFGMVSVLDMMKNNSIVGGKQEPVIYLRNSDCAFNKVEEHTTGILRLENTLGEKIIPQREKQKEKESSSFLDWMFQNPKKIKKMFTVEDQFDCSVQISDHVISSYHSKWNYSQYMISNIPYDSCYAIGTQLKEQSPQEDERLIMFADFGVPIPTKCKILPCDLSNRYFLNCYYPTKFLTIQDKFDPKLAVNNILIRYIQSRFEEFPEVTFYIEYKFNRLEKMGEELFSGGQYSFLETVNDPIMLHPLFFLFALVDMKNDSNPAISKLGNHCEFDETGLFE